MITSDEPRPADGTRLARSAGLTGAATLTSRLLGLARDQVLAAMFGAGNEMDAFVVAYRIPNLVRDLFAEGAMSAAFVPVFTRELTLHGKARAWRTGNAVVTALAVITGAIAIVGIVFARPIVGAYAHDFARIPGKLELTVTLTRVMLPFLVLVAIAAAAMGMLNSLHHYFVPALAPAMFNVAMIAGALALVPLMPTVGWPRITAIAIAALAGGALQVAVQWPALRREGFRFRPVFAPTDPALRHVLVLMGPGTIGLAATQVNLFVNTLLATTQGTGAVSWLTYAFRLMYLPIGIFGVSIATAVLPAVSRHAAIDDENGIRQTVARGIAMMLVLNVPATVGLLALAEPIVRLLFERGHFGPADTAATAAALRFYAIGLVGYSAARITSPTFYALRQSRVPVVVSVCTIALNLMLSVAFVRAIGFRGLALGTALAALANGGALVIVLGRRLRGLEGARLVRTLLGVTVASAAMAAAALAAEHAMLWAFGGNSFGAQAVRLFTAIASGVAVLALVAKLLGVREFDEAAALVRERLGPRRSASL